MGIVIEFALRLLARAAITIAISGLSFLGYEIGQLKQQFATSTPETKAPIVVNIEDNTFSLPQNKIVEQPAATSTKKVTSTQTKKTKTVAKIQQPQIPQTQQPTPQPTQNKISPNITNPSLSNLPTPQIQLPSIQEVTNSVDFGSLNTAFSVAHNTVVNILCVSQSGNLVTVSTGSGVNIDPQGIIITNAHVAELFLIPNKDCTIRTGDIAVDKYKASLVYINENWIRNNAGVIFSGAARGNGENDFALLAITSDVNGNSISQIPYANIKTNELSENNKNDSILVAGYPGGTLGALSLRKILAFVADNTTLTNVFTFSGQTADILETGVTKVGQHGSSGGGVFNTEGKLEGLIDSTDGESGDSRINALTLPYINRAFQSSTGESLQSFIGKDKSVLISNFAQKKDALFEYVKPFVR